MGLGWKPKRTYLISYFNGTHWGRFFHDRDDYRPPNRSEIEQMEQKLKEQHNADFTLIMSVTTISSEDEARA